MKLIILFFVFSLIISCNINKKNTKSFNANEIKVINTGNISLLNRIRTHPGIYIEGSGENAKVYTRGVSSINNQKEISSLGSESGKSSNDYKFLVQKLKSIKEIIKLLEKKFSQQEI